MITLKSMICISIFRKVQYPRIDRLQALPWLRLCCPLLQALSLIHILEAVAQVENIQISDEKVDEEVAKMAEAYKMEVDKLKSYMSESDIKQMKEDLAVQQAVDLLVAEAKLA